MRSALFSVFKTTLVYLLLCTGTFLMARTISRYDTFDDHAGFLSVKQEYIHITVWKIAFYIHVFSSIFTLLAGFTQFSTYLQTHYRKLHRLIGKIYVLDILIINFPAALIMAYYANGFLPSKIAFFILDCLWFWFTLKAFTEARKGNISSHKKYMIRSYALTCSAIALRTWKLILSHTFTIDPVSLYMIDAWLGFVPNLLLAEYIIRKKIW
ncbi:MAG: hypothetical protein JWP12_678 [Bacteroidetes bacterium]|nr:hypothetical protein [Bacteroidota bacterium]